MKFDPLDVMAGAVLSVPGRLVSTALAVVLGFFANWPLEELHFLLDLNQYSIFEPFDNLVVGAFALFYPITILIAFSVTFYRLLITSEFLHPLFILFSIIFLNTALVVTDTFFLALVAYAALLFAYVKIPFLRGIREAQEDFF